MPITSVRLSDSLVARMKRNSNIIWAEVIRRALEEELDRLEGKKTRTGKHDDMMEDGMYFLDVPPSGTDERIALLELMDQAELVYLKIKGHKIIQVSDRRPKGRKGEHVLRVSKSVFTDLRSTLLWSDDLGRIDFQIRVKDMEIVKIRNPARQESYIRLLKKKQGLL